jgi:hypothetical protein
MTRPILIAGLLGGLLGGVVSFTLSRAIKPPKPEPAASAPTELEVEGRKVGDAFMAKLKAKDFDGFAQAVKSAMVGSEQEFAKFKQDLIAGRDYSTGVYGQSTGEFDLVYSRPIGESAVRLVYTEKFERGALVWFLILYHGKDGWRLDSISWNKSLGGALAQGWLN